MIILRNKFSHLHKIRRFDLQLQSHTTFAQSWTTHLVKRNSYPKSSTPRDLPRWRHGSAAFGRNGSPRRPSVPALSAHRIGSREPDTSRRAGLSPPTGATDTRSWRSTENGGKWNGRGRLRAWQRRGRRRGGRAPRGACGFRPASPPRGGSFWTDRRNLPRVLPLSVSGVTRCDRV
jgi:hypothetical protein